MKEIIKSFKHIMLNIYEMFFKKVNVKFDSLDNFILVMLAADYNNLGDVAITYAQREFLKRTFPDKEIMEVVVSDTAKMFLDIKKKVTKNTIITLIGGGNTGDKYELIERYRRFIIRNFKKNKIIIFPQTIDFSDTKYGKYSLNRSIKDYSKNQQLIICARESKSEEIYKKFFNNNIILVPDIVFSLNYEKNNNRLGISLMLRNDSEGSLNSHERKVIIDKALEKFDNVLITDTCIDNFNCDTKYELLFNKIDEIASKEVVITDRLHGMIFCYITKTPCIVIPNNNHKIIMTYNNWLNDCNYIKIMTEFDLEYIFDEIDVLKKINIKKSSSLIKLKHEQLSKILIDLSNNKYDLERYKYGKK